MWCVRITPSCIDLEKEKGHKYMEIIYTPQEKEAFIGSLYDNYKKMMFWTAQKYVSSKEACEDIVQDSFVRILRNIDRFIDLPEYRLETYIFLIVRGLCVDYLRKNDRTMNADLSDEVWLELISQQHQPKASGISAYSKTELQMMVESLSEEDKELLLAHYCMGFSSKELAQNLGTSDSTIRSKLHRAKKQLYELWKKAGVTMGDFFDE